MENPSGISLSSQRRMNEGLAQAKKENLKNYKVNALDGHDTGPPYVKIQNGTKTVVKIQSYTCCTTCQ